MTKILFVMNNETEYNSAWLNEQVERLRAFGKIKKYKEISERLTAYCDKRGEKKFENSNVTAFRHGQDRPSPRFIKAFLAVYGRDLKAIQGKDVPVQLKTVGDSTKAYGVKEKNTMRGEIESLRAELRKKDETIALQQRLLDSKDEIISLLRKSK